MNRKPEEVEIEIEVDNTVDPEIQNEAELIDEEKSAAANLKKWRTKYKEAEAKAAQNLEEVQRTKADFLNSKKRLTEELERSKERIANGFVESLLPLADSFAMAMSNVSQWEAVDENWRKGVEGIYTQLQQILADHGVISIDPTGEHFDPYKHEALSTEENDGESEMVLRVIQLGYERNGNVIRPAKVIISN